MQKFVSKYATAAHLALLAVAPLFLFPFVAHERLAAVLFWLSAIAALWIIMVPSRRRTEMPHGARLRVARSIVADPFFWFMLVAVAFVALRHFNSGIALAYDAEVQAWSLRGPVFEILPGSVDGAGVLPLAGVVSALVLAMGARHALGRSARLCFFVAVSILSGMAAAIASFSLSYGHSGVAAIAECSYNNPTFLGCAFGVLLLGGVVALFACVEMLWRQAELLVGLGLIGTAIGFVTFSPPATIAVFSLAFLLQVIVSFAVAGRRLAGSGALRCALGIMCAVAAAAGLLVAAPSSSALGLKKSAFMMLSIFPENFFAVREVLSRIAFDVWKDNPWLGSGIGSFLLDIRTHATVQDWSVITPMHQAVPSGWWLLIAERGIMGALWFAVALGFLLWSYGARIVGGWGNLHWHPMNVLLPILLPALVAVTFVDNSFMRPDVVMLLVAFLAMSASSFPSRRKAAPAE